MEILLAVATILGGLAALWFFNDKLISVYRYTYGSLFNEGFPRDYDHIDKDWCNATQRRWERIHFNGHYIAWGGPLGFVRDTGDDIPWSHEHIDALRTHRDFDLKYAMPFRVNEYKNRGFSELFETDCRTWRSRIIDRDQFIMMIKARNRPNTLRQWIFNMSRALIRLLRF